MKLIKTLRALLFAFAGTVSVSGLAFAEEMHVYKSPYCGCCQEWINIAEQAGHKMTWEHHENLSPLKETLGVPKQLASCHTVTAEGYFFEGHVPVKDVERLLAEKPDDIAGLAVPGMPALSPGMAPEGAPIKGFNVIAIHKDGSFSIWARY